MPFLAILRENGGCDHTIGCGVRVVHVPCDNECKAAAIVWLLAEGHFRGTEGCELQSVELFWVRGCERVDLKEVYALEARAKQLVQGREAKRIEQVKLTELREKYPYSEVAESDEEAVQWGEG